MKKSKFKLFPVPVFETSPGEGQRYGVMPTILMLDKKEHLSGIGFGSVYYNPKVVKLGTFGGFMLYPSNKETLEFFYEFAQNYVRNYSVEYRNEWGLDGRLQLETEVEYEIDPFERFYGFGPDTTKEDQTNFVSRTWLWKGRAAYEVFDDIYFQLEENWHQLRLRTRAIPTLADTITFFANVPEVASSDQWTHELSAFWDTRDSKDLPKRGHFVKTTFLLSHAPFDSQNFYYGYKLHGKKLIPHTYHWMTVVSFKMDQVFGDFIPFYLQPKLGGNKDLRGFGSRRFVGRGRFLIDIEERIVVKRLRVMDVDFDLSVDPFFTVGQVFNRWGDLDFSNLQPVGGVGIRAKIPPSLVGRVDLGYGSEGLQIFTTLDYPF